jgi:ATP-dependent Lon protease
MAHDTELADRIRELLAAQRAGLSTVFIPQRNEPDLDDTR